MIVLQFETLGVLKKELEREGRLRGPFGILTWATYKDLEPPYMRLMGVV